MTTPTQTGGITAATSLGPLTTRYSPPASCFPGTPYSDTEDGTKIYKVGTVSADDDCLPPDWVVNGYYSPGICPRGYTAVCEAPGDNVATTIWPKFNKYGCGYYTTFARSEFATVLAPSVMVLNAASDTDTSAESSSSSLGSRPTGSIPSSEVRPTGSTNTANPDSIRTNTASPTGIPDAGPSPSDISSIDTPSQNESDSSNSGLRVLGGGAIAGIVVGVVGALLLGAAGTFFFMRRILAKNNNNNNNNNSNTPSSSSQSPPAFPPHNPNESAISELHDKSRPLEMPESNALYELHEPHGQSEMPTWSEQNPHGPNKPMAWELPA
ncbi:hypothetical protein Daesc_001033 [Daldinia eschscholtzii]|uniref:Uncharacterized protein n=1 Tax=Daldinia eschscholtzii TaxID=292717 RepID=A0AAX6N0R3_9PEZI